MSNLCELCQKQQWKYKCPTCGLKYCSVVCYKPHKAQHANDAPNETITTETISEEKQNENNNNSIDTQTTTIENTIKEETATISTTTESTTDPSAANTTTTTTNTTTNTNPNQKKKQNNNNNNKKKGNGKQQTSVSDEQFAKLANSEDIKRLVSDSRLQKLISEIDSNQDREAILIQTLASNPEFSSFVQTLLTTIEQP